MHHKRHGDHDDDIAWLVPAFGMVAKGANDDTEGMFSTGNDQEQGCMVLWLAVLESLGHFLISCLGGGSKRDL